MQSLDTRAAEITETIERASRADNGSLNAAFLAVAHMFARLEARMEMLEVLAKPPMMTNLGIEEMNDHELHTAGFIKSAQDKSPLRIEPRKFRRKPVVVEAVQAQEGRMSLIPGVWRDVDTQSWVIRILEGNIVVSPGDWIITDAIGNRDVCPAEIFAEAYELVENDDA